MKRAEASAGTSEHDRASALGRMFGEFILSRKALALMTNQFANLTDLLKNNPPLRDAFFRKFHGKVEYPLILDNLISFFANTHRDMLVAKIKETSTLKKFSSLASELETAKIFAQEGCEISLLLDNHFKNASPDILCKYLDFSFYVEVTQLSDSEPALKIIEELRELLHDKPFVARIEFNDFQPCFSGKERYEQEKILEKSMIQFKNELDSVTLELMKYEIITDGFKVIFSDSEGKPGTVDSFASCYKFPDTSFEEYVTYRLLEKAKKRVSFEGSEKHYPYILAFVCENKCIDNIDFENLLYGRTIKLSIFPSADSEEIRLLTIQRDKHWEEIVRDKKVQIPKWEEIEAAAGIGWEDFLKEINYIPNDYKCLVKEGLYLTDPLMKNVSGILLIRRSMAFHFFPNPFCDPEISLVNHQEFFDSL